MSGGYPSAAGGNLPLHALPDLLTVFGAALRNGQRIHHVQHALQRTVEFAAVAASFQVLLGGEGIALFAVIKQDQLLFVQMLFAELVDQADDDFRSLVLFFFRRWLRRWPDFRRFRR